MSNKQDKKFNGKDVLNMLFAVNDLFDGSGQIFNQYHHEPAVNSIAAQEQQNFPKPGLVNDVHYRGMLSMEAAGDHLVGFTACIAEPAKTLAPATCVRGLLESCALAAWFLDPTIDAKTRVGRCFAFRYEGFVQQIKVFQVEKRQSEIDQVRQRMTNVEQDAISLGYSQLLNKHGAINGIAQHMPGITELIGTTLNEETTYRLLSGVAHGHHWAIQQLGFQDIETKDSRGKVIKALEKHLHPNVALYLGLIATRSFARVIWYLWRLYGWNLNEVEHLLDTTYDKLKIRAELRFWH
jgi:hypothetical protein